MEANSQTLNCMQTTPIQTIKEFECPSCNARLTSKQQVVQHCELEVERLKKMQADTAIQISEPIDNNTNNVEQTTRKPYSIFQRVQRNRQARLKLRSRKRLTPPISSSEQICPICNVNYPQNEIQRHAEKCLRKMNGLANGGNGDNSHSSNDDDGEEYEEYEWAGQKRIRASSLLEGGYTAIGIGQCLTIRNGQDADEDEDLNVDEDDTQIYGPAQYEEADVIFTKNSENENSTNAANEEEDVTNYMRKLITSGSGSIAARINSNTAIEDEREYKTEATLHCQPSSSTAAAEAATKSCSILPQNATENLNSSHFKQIIDSLKARLRNYESHGPTKYKCLICLDDYRNPAVSVSCWHVHCEDCWLRSLGARKLCPQCNLITTPKDLRRIYM